MVVVVQGLGKGSKGIVEPIQAKASGRRLGLGMEQQAEEGKYKILPGDSYRTIMQKKALQRFAQYPESQPPSAGK